MVGAQDTFPVDQDRAVVQPIPGALLDAADDVDVVPAGEGAQQVEVGAGDGFGGGGGCRIQPAHQGALRQHDEVTAGGRCLGDCRGQG
jgi:hypothetical protein